MSSLRGLILRHMGNIVRCRQCLSVNPLPDGKVKDRLQIKNVPSSFSAELCLKAKEMRKEVVELERVI